MKRPYEYWIGRMYGMLLGIAKVEAVPEYLRELCSKVVAEFDEDFKEGLKKGEEK